MKYMRQWTVLLSVLLSMSLISCTQANAPAKAPETQQTTVRPSNSESDQSDNKSSSEKPTNPDMLTQLQARMADEPQIALAAAYLGHRERNDTQAFTEWVKENTPNAPFIWEIPEEYIVGVGYGDVYCIVPRDSSTSIAVNHVTWRSNGAGVFPNADEVLYREEYAKPLLVFVGFEEFRDEPDVGIYAISDNGAQLEWYPFFHTDTGIIDLPTGEGYKPLLLDFSGEIDTEEEVWSAPTTEALADTEWHCGGDWHMELNADGTAKLYVTENNNSVYTGT